MKKALTVAIAVLLVALSVLPAFAESVQSPTAKPTKYVVTVDTSAGGGSADVKYEGEIGPDGTQKILLTASPEEGFPAVISPKIPAASLLRPALRTLLPTSSLVFLRWLLLR